MSDASSPDVWQFVRAEVPAAYRAVKALIDDPPHGLWDALEARFRRGREAYGARDEWLEWPAERFEREEIEELLDLILYAAMRRVVHPG